MKKLARRPAIEISLTRFNSDAELLTNALAEIEGRQQDAHAEAAPTAEQSKAPPARAHVAAAASSQAASTGATPASAPLKPASRRSLPYLALAALIIVAAIAWLAGGQQFDTVLEKLTGEHVSIPDQRRGSDIAESEAPMPEVDQSPRGAAPRAEDNSIVAPPASPSGQDADAAEKIDLGDRYYYEIGVETDYDKALNPYRQAAEQALTKANTISAGCTTTDAAHSKTISKPLPGTRRLRTPDTRPPKTTSECSMRRARPSRGIIQRP